MFEFILIFFTGFLFVPINSYVFNKILNTMGSRSLLNADVFKVVLSYKGLGAFVFAFFISIIIMFLEYGIIIILAQKNYFDKDVSIFQALFITIKNLPKIFGFGMIQLFLFLFILLPFIDTPLSDYLLNNYNLLIMFNSKINNPDIYLGLYVLGFILIIYAILRWIFVLHFIIIEGKSSKEAIKLSSNLTKHNTIKILFYMFVTNIVVFSIIFTFLTYINYIPSYINSVKYSILVKRVLITFSSFVTYFASLFLIPLNITFITRVFYKLRRNNGEIIQDDIELPKMKFLLNFEGRIKMYFSKKKIKLKYVLFIIVLIFFSLNFLLNNNILGWNIKIAAHRGDVHNNPENSLSAINYAIDEGADFIEIDVQMTKDKIVVLNHDSDLMRILNVPSKVSDLTLEEIKKYDIGSKIPPDYIGEQIPTLQEVLDETDGKVKLIIEIKADGHTEEEEGIEQQVVSLLEENDRVKDCYIQCFDYSTLKIVRELNPDIKIGQILYLSVGDLSYLDVDFYTIRQSMLTDNFVTEAHKNNRDVWVWTVNVDSNIKEVAKYDIDGIITDYPERVRLIIGS